MQHWVIVGLVSAPVLLILGWLFFASWRSFFERLLTRRYITREEIENEDDSGLRQDLKTKGFLLIAAGLVYAAHVLVRHLGW
jgi:hypothetical protein